MRTSAMTRKTVAILVGAAIVPVTPAIGAGRPCRDPGSRRPPAQSADHDQIVLRRNGDRAVPFDPVIGAGISPPCAATDRRRSRSQQRSARPRASPATASTGGTRWSAPGRLRSDAARRGSPGAHPAKASRPASGPTYGVAPVDPVPLATVAHYGVSWSSRSLPFPGRGGRRSSTKARTSTPWAAWLRNPHSPGPRTPTPSSGPSCVPDRRTRCIRRSWGSSPALRNSVITRPGRTLRLESRRSNSEPRAWTRSGTGWAGFAGADPAPLIATATAVASIATARIKR